MQQLFFDFPIKPTYLLEDFFLSSANDHAFTYLNQWPNWDNGIYSKIVLLHGEPGSGKTHLTYIWKNLSDAKILTIEECNNLELFLEKNALIFEDIESIDAELLLHLINFAYENNQYLLLTSKLSPSQLSFSLADLQSRILSIPEISIKSPDQSLLKAVLLKYLSDRQLKISPISLEYVILRIDRSFSKLKQFIDELDKMSAVSKRSITIPLIRKALNIF